MSQYQHLLLAADFAPESAPVEQRARALADALGAKLSAVHVQEPIAIAYGGEFPMDLTDLHHELEKRAKEQLQQLGERLNIPAAQRHFVIGITEKEILNLAQEEKADLLVVGSHGRHGLALLLGSTANDVLHHASMDVLAVKVSNQDQAD